MKKIKVIAGIVIVLIIGGIIFAPSLDDIIKKSIEYFGSKVTKTEVKLKKVDLSLKDGKLSLYDFYIKNPKGFSNNKMISFGNITVDIDVKSLTSDVIKIETILVSKPSVLFEMGKEKSNLATLLDTLSSSSDTSPEPEKNETKEAPAEGKKIIIKKLTVEKGSIGINIRSLGDKKLTVPLPSITMTNIGEDKKGASPSEIAKQIVQKITSVAQNAAISADAVKNALGNISDNIKNGASNVTNSIKGFFNK
ncbi:MAG: hypothetical protein AB7U85_05040 [Alphaproteobacteria bacterium]